MTFPVGTQFAIYTADGTLVRKVPMDVDTGMLLEPVTLEPGQTLWMALPGGPPMPVARSSREQQS